MPLLLEVSCYQIGGGNKEKDSFPPCSAHLHGGCGFKPVTSKNFWHGNQLPAWRDYSHVKADFPISLSSNTTCLVFLLFPVPMNLKQVAFVSYILSYHLVPTRHSNAQSRQKEPMLTHWLCFFVYILCSNHGLGKISLLFGAPWKTRSSSRKLTSVEGANM